MTECLEDLNFKNLKIYQPKNGYRFTSDSVYLANFIKTKKNDVALELCSGCGVISVLLSKKQKQKKIYGIELQENLANLFKKSIKFNNLEDSIEILCDNAKNYNKYFQNNSFDVVFANPPYYKIGTGKQTSSVEINTAKYENELDLNTFFQISSKLLKPKGHFYFCHDAKRLFEIFITLKNFNLAPKEMFFTHGNEKLKASTVFIHAQKDANCTLDIFQSVLTNNQTFPDFLNNKE